MKLNLIFRDIFFRYLLIVLSGLGNLYLFYLFFSWPTINLSGLILSLFRETQIVDTLIIFGETLLKVAPSCVAGSAYFLLFFLAMSIPLALARRVKLIIYCFSVFFLVNVLRIVIMALVVDFFFFEEIHLFFWHVFSTIFLIGTWFSAIKIFKIRKFPVYTDFLTIKQSRINKSIQTKNRKSDR